MFSNLDDPTWARCPKCNACFDSWANEPPHKAECPYCAHRPIPVSERLPTVGWNVLVLCRGTFDNEAGEWHDARLEEMNNNAGETDNRHWRGQGPMTWWLRDVTHWLPLPPKPE